jgi:hypothetical protein
MVTAQLKTTYALALALLNGVIIALTYLATQNTANGITITIGVGAVLAGLEGAIHYEQTQPGISADFQNLLTTINSTLQAVQNMLTSVAQSQSQQTPPQAQQPPAASPPAPTVPTLPKITYTDWTWTPALFAGEAQAGVFMRIIYKDGKFAGQQTSITDPRTDPKAVITTTMQP